MISYEYKPSFYQLDSVGNKGIYQPKKLFWFSLSVIIIALIVTSFLTVEQNWSSLFSGNSSFNELFKGLFDWTNIDFTTKNLAGESFLDRIGVIFQDTIFNAFAGTLLGGVIALPLVLAASTNIIKFRWINYSIKTILAVIRTIPIFLYAMILLWFFQPSESSQLILLIAISVFTISTICKMLYDKIEQVNMGTFNLLEGMGVNKVQAFRQTIIPQIGKFTITTLFYAFEVNVRYLTILGLGLNLGFGYEIEQNINQIGNYNKAGFLVFLLILLVFAIELASWLTKKFIFSNKDKPINLKSQYVSSWTAKSLKLIPTNLYGKIFSKDSLNRLKLDQFFFYRKAHYDYVLNKVKHFDNQQLTEKDKLNYHNYKKFLNEKFKLDRQLFKYQHQKETLDQNSLVSAKFLLCQELNEDLTIFCQIHQQEYDHYLKDNKYFEQNFNQENNRFYSNKSIKDYDQKVLSSLTNSFYSEQTNYLTPDYVLLQQPYSWVKKTVFFVALIILFIIFVSQISYSLENETALAAGKHNLGLIFIPSWDTFFGTKDYMQYSAFELIGESILIAVMGTFLGFIISFILGALSSNVVAGKYLSKPFWLLATVIRPTPSYIYAILLISIVPMGPFAGVLALTIATTGMLSKYIRETFNNINLDVIDNLYSIGLTRFQILIYGIIPQVTSEIMSWALYRFDVNIREVSTLGAVGAGHMGFWLREYLDSANYSEFATLMYSLIITSLIIEFVISASRAKILDDKNLKVYDWLVHKLHQLTKPKYLLAYQNKGYNDGIQQSWYILKSDYLKSIHDLRNLKHQVELDSQEAEAVIDQKLSVELTNKFDQDYVSQQLNELVKNFNPNYYVKNNNSIKRINSLKFIKAYAIYYGYIQGNEKLTSSILTQVLVDNTNQKMLVKNLKLQLNS